MDTAHRLMENWFCMWSDKKCQRGKEREEKRWSQKETHFTGTQAHTAINLIQNSVHPALKKTLTTVMGHNTKSFIPMANSIGKGKMMLRAIKVGWEFFFFLFTYGNIYLQSFPLWLRGSFVEQLVLCGLIVRWFVVWFSSIVYLYSGSVEFINCIILF